VTLLRLFILILCLVVVMGATWFLAGAEIDNRFQFFAGRDLRLVCDLQTSRGRLGDVVKGEYGTGRWRAYHFDELYLTVVDYSVVNSKGLPVTLSWEVGHNYSPRPDLPVRKLTVFALTREAASLTPDLMPPGVSLETYPESWARIFHSSALAPDSQWRPRNR
jgi:hypothetical protein